MLRVDFDSRDAMIRFQPDVFYITDHYRDYPAGTSPAQDESAGPSFGELLADAWRFVAPGACSLKRVERPHREGRGESRSRRIDFGP